MPPGTCADELPARCLRVGRIEVTGDGGPRQMVVAGGDPGTESGLQTDSPPNSPLIRNNGHLLWGVCRRSVASHESASSTAGVKALPVVGLYALCDAPKPRSTSPKGSCETAFLVLSSESGHR